MKVKKAYLFLIAVICALVLASCVSEAQTNAVSGGTDAETVKLDSVDTHDTDTSTDTSADTGADTSASHDTSDTTPDDAERTPTPEYEQALSLIDEGKYEDAYYLLLSISKKDSMAEEKLCDFHVVSQYYCWNAAYKEVRFTTTQEYNEKGQILNVVYEENEDVSEEKYTYDEQYRLVKEEHIYYDGYRTKYEYSYDGEGNLIEKRFTDPYAAETTKYTYENGVLLRKEHDLGYRVETTVYTYDPSGRLSEVALDLGKYTIKSVYTYDARGRLIKEEYLRDDQSPVVKPYEINYTYGKTGNLIKEEKTESGTVVYTIVYTYDERSQLVREEKTTPYDGYIFEYGYNDMGLLLEIKKKHFDDNRTEINDESVSSILYSYDDMGKMLSKQEMRDISTDIITLYSYDKNGNLIKLEQYFDDEMSVETWSDIRIFYRPGSADNKKYYTLVFSMN